ncbi:hypothetical protein [Novosphingobium sp. PC22D]|uniref:hypothetical protein n=1 Tax=Novosphingobium sp. PC22D TaxID=1962403 RepID=UPI001145C5C6|nr:hypothetical protein [Novosphingobium sp. PC22D]
MTEKKATSDAKATQISDTDLDQVQGGLGNFEIQDFKASKPHDARLGNFEIQDFQKKPRGKNLGNFEIQD